MKTIQILFTVILMTAGLTFAQNDDTEVLKNLLIEFLEGASMNDPEIHERFWADDLIYTSAIGERITKADIMNTLPDDSDSLPEEELPVYSAEDIQINLYGNTAVLSFRLVAEFPLENGQTEQMYYYNSGTFVKMDSRWQAVSWQATSIPD
jgi:hypothetical protein